MNDNDLIQQHLLFAVLHANVPQQRHQYCGRLHLPLSAITYRLGQAILRFKHSAPLSYPQPPNCSLCPSIDQWFTAEHGEVRIPLGGKHHRLEVFIKPRTPC